MEMKTIAITICIVLIVLAVIIFFSLPPDGIDD